MNGADIATLVIISLMALRVSFKGFIAEFSGKAGIIIGISASLLFSPPFSLFLDSRLSLGIYSQIAALVALFISGYLMAKYLLSSLEVLFASLHLGFLDHILGLGLGALEGAFVAMTIVYLMGMQNTIDLTYLYATSTLLPKMYPAFPEVFSILSNSITDVMVAP